MSFDVFVLVHDRLSEERMERLHSKNIVFVKACHFCKNVYKMKTNIERETERMGRKKNKNKAKKI